ncbi:Monooxygenase [Perkinsela sp. CCAP 1560/4]|nr:Monooxygenase [Perkinsela sp. CCAP 1560/4]|eukprot:KNH07271.1 Monooxygenase [Perkinsela sp. CCAP 1560/4]
MTQSTLRAATRLTADICIVGHGLPGFVLFTALRQNPQTKHMKIALLDKDPLPANGSEDASRRCVAELRTVSLTQTSTRILNRLALGSPPSLPLPSSESFVDSCNSHRFRQMTVRDMKANVFTIPTTGCITGLHTLWMSAWRASHALEEATDNHQVLCGSIEGLETSTDSGNTVVQVKSSELGCSTYAIETKLLVGSDGAKSTVRQSVNTRCLSMDYRQRAFVFCVRVEDGSVGCGTHHQATCYQNFLDDGSIVAFLPTGKSSGNIVLSASSALGERITTIIAGQAKSMTESTQTSLLHLLNSVLHQRAPDDIPRLVGILADSTPRLNGLQVASFPLALNVALRPFSTGSVLIGDAARTIHPLAGQGLNLGIADSAVLFDCILEVVQRGGSLSTEVGGLYGRRMRKHTWPMIASTEIVSGAFSSQNYWINAMRKYGCALVNDSRMLQQVLSDFASGQYISASLAQ